MAQPESKVSLTRQSFTRAPTVGATTLGDQVVLGQSLRSGMACLEDEPGAYPGVAVTDCRFGAGIKGTDPFPPIFQAIWDEGSREKGSVPFISLFPSPLFPAPAVASVRDQAAANISCPTADFAGRMLIAMS